MLNITVNGEARSIPEQKSLAALLKELEINHRYCAVERNRALVPREQHADCMLQDGDEIEIVTLVGGG